jgi:hypothetical protein
MASCNVGLPVPGECAGDKALVVSGGIHVDFDEADVRIFGVRGHPFGADQNLRVSIPRHGVSSVAGIQRG